MLKSVCSLFSTAFSRSRGVKSCPKAGCLETDTLDRLGGRADHGGSRAICRVKARASRLDGSRPRLTLTSLFSTALPLCYFAFRAK